MKTYVIAFAALAVMGLASAAYAGDAAKPKAMSDSEMDKVTAGQPLNPGFGRNTAGEAGGNLGRSNPSFPAGQGRCTAFFHGGNVPGPVLCTAQ